MSAPAALLLAAGLAAAAPTPLFTDVTREAGIPPLRYSEGVVFTDLDNDGRPDLFLPVVHGRDRLFRNEGGGRFVEVTSERGIVENDGIGAVAGDLDNDGRPDLYVARGAYPAGRSVLYRQATGGRFEDVSTTSGLDGPGNHMSAVLGDFDLDGRLDILCLNWGVNSLFRNESMDGHLRFRDVTGEAGLTEEGKSWGAAAADFNGDGAPDLAVARGTKGKNEPSRVFLNDGRGRFTDASSGTDIGRLGWSMGVVAADFDGDGHPDLYFTGYEEPGGLFLNDGKGGFRDATAGSGLTAGGCIGAAAGDLDGDLLADLVVAGFTGPVRVYRNLGGGKFREITAEAGLETADGNEGVALADFDGDGDLDLYVANYQGNNRLYRNNSPGGAWVKIRPRIGRRAAVGAAVFLYRSGGLGKREALLARQDLQAGHGFCSQGPDELLFRPPGPGPWDVSVIFPGGRRVDLPGIGPGTLDVHPPDEVP
jgi:hypothetical protein